MELCSGDMLLEALVACAGVTLKAVATALEFKLDGATVSAEGDLDFRGTLGVAKDAPVGFRAIRLSFDLETNEPQERIDSLLKLTERYCVVFQTINQKPELSVTARTSQRPSPYMENRRQRPPRSSTSRPIAITLADSTMSAMPTHSSGRWARSRMPGP